MGVSVSLGLVASCFPFPPPSFMVPWYVLPEFCPASLALHVVQNAPREWLDWEILWLVGYECLLPWNPGRANVWLGPK